MSEKGRGRLPRRRAAAVLAALATVSSTLVIGQSASALTPVARINFQSQTASVPSGYLSDYGQAFDATRGYGWIQQSTSTPLSLVGNGRDRDVVSDQRLDTFMHMQYPGTSGGVSTPGRWEYAVPNGSYQVTVSVGDASFIDSMHRISVEGTLAVNDFVPTNTTKFQQATVTVDVSDGEITLDAAGGTNTKIDYVDIDAVGSAPPSVVSVDPANGATGISTSAAVTVSLSEPADPATVDAAAMQLLAPDSTVVDGTYNTDAAGSLVSFTPLTALAKNTTYTVKTTSSLKTLGGTAYTAFQSTFTTGTGQTPPAGLAHTRTTFASLDGNSPTVVTMGPDGKLYVATAAGQILRYTLGANGLPTGVPQTFNTFQNTRIILGLHFDPASTASDLRLWVSHGEAGYEDMPNFTGKISLLTGANLTTARDVIVGLPRAVVDHMNNGIDFGPDGKLYIAQGSLNGYGAPDSFWGNRAETPLSAAILVADVANDARFAGTVDVKTDAPTSYDVTAANAPVKIYASGTRNPFDLVWHSSGMLYAPVNESAGGNAPAGPDNIPPALTNLPPGRDFLAQVKPGKYYGHPNPSRGEYVLNGGNPTSSMDPFETSQYPVGQQPDADWDKPILDFGLHRSPDGIAEYSANAYNGQITGDLLVAEFSNGDDIVLLDRAADGSINQIRQFAVGFNNPLDVAVNSGNGDIYVAEYGDQASGAGAQITVLQPSAVSTTPVFRVNFQPAASTAPSGYAVDSGQAYTSTRGYGWIAQASGTPQDMTPYTRERNAVSDQRLDTLIHMQPSSGPAGRWEHAVPNGHYVVTLAVGDPSFTDSLHRVTVEGVLAVDNFTPTSTQKQTTRTVEVNVSDGKITFDAAGGTNTKIDYIDVDTTDVAAPTSFHINFQPAASAVPSGYNVDSGQAYASARGYGWIAQSSSTGLDMTSYTRERNAVSDQRLDTLIHMQPSSAAAGRWEHDVANGTYTVTVGLGDPSFTDSVNRLTIEGVLAVDNFTPTSTQKQLTRTIQVNVSDSKMTFDAAGGTNTKFDYVDVAPAGSTDTTPPSVNVTTSGTTDASGAYVGSATVTINASDSGSGLASVTYTLDGGPPTTYTGPFTVATNGSHTVVATATDNAGNSANATKTFSVTGAAAGADITVVSPDAALGVPDHLTFSTVNEETRPARALTVRNDGTNTLSVTNVTISGGAAADFKLTAGQATAFSLAPGASTTISIQFAPISSGVENYTTLTIISNDADEASYNVALAGLDANDYEGNNEPTLSQIKRVFGYTHAIGTENRAIGTTRLPVGDEIITPYFNRVDTSKPAQLIPLARYSGRTTTAGGCSGWFPINTSTKNQLYCFPGGSDISGGQNQRLLPGITGGTPFNPTTAFGLYSQNDWSDDGKNSPNKIHNFRAYPVEGVGGAIVPNAWFVATDIGSDINSTGKNYDYQDHVYLLLNAAPAWPTASAVGPATTLEFGSAKPGTIADKDGEGTGFTSALGGGLDASKIDLQASSGRLALTSTAGTNSGSSTTQVNALQLAFDATRQRTLLHTRIIGPLTQLTAPLQHQAVVFGPDRNNFAKIEAEYRNGKPHLVLYLEQNGSGSLPATPIPLPAASTISTLDLFLTLDVANGAINGSYLVNSDDFDQAQPFGPSMSPSDVMRWFSTDARAGVLVSNEGTTTTFTGLFDRFAATVAPTRGFSTVTWTQKAISPMHRAEANGTVVDGKLYVFGGYSDTTFVPRTRSDVYNPATDTWTRLADMPVATTHAGTFAIGRSVYLAGGYITNGGTGQIFATTNVWRYDIDTNTWSAATPLPAARGSGGLVALGTKLHFFGGVDTARADKGDHWILDTSSGSPSWVTSVAIPNPRSHMGAVAMGGRIWAIGGDKGHDTTSVAQNTVNVWDPAFPTMWIPMAQLPRGLSHISGTTVVADNRIIVMGGQVTHSQTRSDVLAYDPASNTWRYIAPLPTPRTSGVGGWIGGKLYYATGGLTNTNFQGTPS